MTSYLAYSYNVGLTKKKQLKIDKKAKKSRKDFSKGFIKGANLSLAAYSLYSLATSAAYAEDLCSSSPKPPEPVKDIAKPKPGFKPLSPGTKGVAISEAGGVCTAALQSGDFILGLMFAILLIGIGVINNRPD